MGAHDFVDRLRRQLSAALRTSDVVLDLCGIGVGEVAASLGRPVTAVVVNEGAVALIEIPLGGDSAAPRAAATQCVPTAAALLPVLKSSGAGRLIVIAGGAIPHGWQQCLCAVEEGGIDIVRLQAAAGADADDFMSPDDAAAVTARLRQLGYI